MNTINEKLEDISTICTIVELMESGILKHPDDIQALSDQLNSDWGKRVFSRYHQTGKIDDKDRDVLSRYSDAL